jgi:glucose 1-dehydrogenase
MKTSPFSLKGKKVLVTGGASGIGLGICKGFARLGCSVIVSDISQIAGERAATLLRQKFKVKSAYIYCDLTKAASVADLATSAKKAFGRVDILINNCRAGQSKPFDQETEGNWDLNLNTMAKACFFLSRGILPLMPAGSSIINISSVLSYAVGGEAPSYHVAKAAVDQLTRYLAVQCGSKQVRVNAIAPGFIVKEPHLKRFHSKASDEYRAIACYAHPSGAIGLESDVANAAAFLASDAARFVTGQVLVVDGGLTIQEPFMLLHGLRSKPAQRKRGRG